MHLDTCACYVGAEKCDMVSITVTDMPLQAAMAAMANTEVVDADGEERQRFS